MNTAEGLYDIRVNREIIYLEAIKELHARVSANERHPYPLVRKGAILRFLLIDGSKFYAVINRPYNLKFKTKLKFQVSQKWSMATIGDPRGLFLRFAYQLDSNGEDITIQKFMQQQILLLNDSQHERYHDKRHISDTYDVSSIIKLIANAHGGVHIEDWGNKVPGHLMTDEISPFNINANSHLHEIMNNIAGIVIHMLEPLTISVLEHLKSTRAIAWESSITFEVKEKK